MYNYRHDKADMKGLTYRVSSFMMAISCSLSGRAHIARLTSVGSIPDYIEYSTDDDHRLELRWWP